MRFRRLRYSEQHAERITAVLDAGGVVVAEVEYRS
jgi:hypothetical protein